MTRASIHSCGEGESQETQPAKRSLPDASGLIDLISRNARERPQATAIRFGSTSVTYAELHARSNRLAARLHAAGAKPGALVGLLVERSPWLPIGLIAILKTGSAYVPLDPAYPPPRLNAMIEDGGIVLLLTEEPILSELGLAFNGPVLFAGETGDEHHDSGTVDLVVHDEPEYPAYVIFTSGSTGRPKGVEITRASLMNVLQSLRQRPGLDASDTMLAVTSIAFDIAAVEIFLPLLTGATILLASREEAAIPSRLLQLLETGRATVLQATPVTWRLLILAGWTGKTSLRVWCGGEEMTAPLARDLLSRSSAVWNLYGPTETTIWSTCMRVGRTTNDVPLGSPVANTYLFVLDEDRRQVAADQEGELYIGGAGLAKSYWCRPDLTAQSFPTVPLADERAMRLYRTGDRVRLRSDGELQFLGRADRQIKLRGYRIELGEIEQAARWCPGVQEVVVNHIHDGERGGFLAAFAVAESGSPLVATDLRSHLLTRLPAYMVPSSIRIVDSLPTTANGKLDRKQLATLNGPGVTVLDAFDHPHDGLESRLASIWSEALGVTQLGRHDNFFAVGGDSLLAAEVELAMARKIGEHWAAGSLFRSPTVAMYAASLRGRRVPTSVLLHPGTRCDCIFWMDNPERLPRLASLLGDRPFYSILLSEEEIAREAPSYALPNLAASAKEHILALQPRGRYVIAGFCQNALLAYEVAQQLVESGSDVPLLLLVDPGECAMEQNLPFSVSLERRIARERFHLRTMLGLPFAAWTDYLKERYEGFRFQSDGRRWQRAARGQASAPAPTAKLCQALFAAKVAYDPKPYSGRVLFIEPTLRPEDKSNSTAEGWSTLVADAKWRSVAGDHLGLFVAPAVDGLAAVLKQELDATHTLLQCYDPDSNLRS